MTTLTKWTSTAGPRQTKAVNEAISALKWRGKTRAEIRDSGRTELVAMCAEPSAECLEALERIGAACDYTITAANYRDIVAQLDAAKAALVLPEDDCRSTEAERIERAQRQAEQRASSEAHSQAVKESCAAIMAKKPAWAEAAIVAELDEDDSDMMTDYHNHRTTRRVVIGWRKGKREDFRQLRAAAAQFEPTKHLGTGLGVFRIRAVWATNCPEYTHCQGDYRPGYELDRTEYQTREAAEKAIADSTEDMRLNYQGKEGTITGLVEYRISEEELEHRENYSMGAGNYLKHGHRDSSGWCVKSYNLPLCSDVFEDGLPVAPVAAVDTAPVVAGGYSVQKHFHTKRQCDIWAVVLVDRVERSEFERLRDSATAARGWFSSKWGTFPGGFCFTTEAQAVEWAAKNLGGNSGAELSAPEPQPAPTSEPVQTVASKLRETAEKLTEKIEERTRPMTQNYTPKRGREYNARLHEGENLRRCQQALNALADLHERKECPAILANLRTKAQVLPLVSTSGDSQGYYDYRDSGKYRDNSEQGKALQAILSPDKKSQQQRELDYKLQELQRTDIPGFFPTPRTVALQVVELAGIRGGDTVLEPSAGAGHLAEVIRTETYGMAVSILCCERMHSLRDILKLKGFALTEDSDFLEMEPREDIDRILMNPPFENGQDIEHVRKAYEMLADEGRLVSVVSSGVSFRTDRKTTEFREWLDSVGGTVEPLPPGSFDTSEAFRRTGVSASLVVVCK